MAFVPRTPLGLGALVALVLFSRVLIAGFITLRATVWRTNYPRTDRARITGKLSTVQSVAAALTGILGGLAMEHSVQSFRWLMPTCALVGLLGVASYSRIRMRGHRRLLRAEREADSDERPGWNPVSVYHILKDDPLYRRFMVHMFTLGIGNLMLTAPLVVILRERFKQDYVGGILITSTIPLAALTIAVPFWARLLQRTHVIAFRAIHSWAFVLCQLFVFLAAFFNSMWLMYLGAVFLGIGFGGGALAWNLGHLDFAPPEKASQYMGVHVTLTGVRGLIASFLIMGAYEWLERQHEGAGIWVLACSVLLCIAGAVGFVRMNRMVRSDFGAERAGMSSP